MQTVVLKLDMHDDERCKRRVMKTVSTIHGVDSISLNTKDQKLTLVGNMDTIILVQKLRKVFHTDVVSVGPVKQPEKKKEEPKVQAQVVGYMKPIDYYSYPTYPNYSTYYNY